MRTASPCVTDLGVQVKDYLEGSDAKQTALKQRIWKDRSAKGPVLSRNPYRFQPTINNGDYSAMILPEYDGLLPHAAAHLQPFRQCTFVNTSTHTMFSRDPPDGEAKPGLMSRCYQSPIRYRGTMLSDTPNRLPAAIVMKQDTRLAHVVKPPKEYVPGPGEIIWEQAQGRLPLGPHYGLSKSSASLAPGHDPYRPSQPFTATRRADPATLGSSAAPDTVYSPAVPNYTIWLSSGFATTSKLRDIKAETWGCNLREPRSPHTSPGQKVTPVLGNNGLPYDISAQARPGPVLPQTLAAWPGTPQPTPPLQSRHASRGAHTAPASASYGRRNLANLMRHPGRETQSGTRSTVKCPYTRPAEMGPGAAFPVINFNAPRYVACADRPHVARIRPQRSQIQPLLHARAVEEVRQQKWSLQQQYMSHRAEAVMAWHSEGDQLDYTRHEVPLEVRQMEVLRRMGLQTA
eukprot:jgi/Ulvmu1/9214/UM005_0314.1